MAAVLIDLLSRIPPARIPMKITYDMCMYMYM